MKNNQKRMEQVANKPGAPKLLITPIFPDFFRFFPVFPWASGCVPWIPGVQTLKMGERWGKMGKQWVKNEITGVQKTALMHASAGPGRQLQRVRRHPHHARQTRGADGI